MFAVCIPKTAKTEKHLFYLRFSRLHKTQCFTLVLHFCQSPDVGFIYVFANNPAIAGLILQKILQWFDFAHHKLQDYELQDSIAGLLVAGLFNLRIFLVDGAGIGPATSSV